MSPTGHIQAYRQARSGFVLFSFVTGEWRALSLCCEKNSADRELMSTGEKLWLVTFFSFQPLEHIE